MSGMPYNEGDASWAQITLLQALMVQLIATKAISVEDAELVFASSLLRAERAKEVAPDAMPLIQHIHDTMPWADLHQWSTQKRNSEDGKS